MIVTQKNQQRGKMARAFLQLSTELNEAFLSAQDDTSTRALKVTFFLF